VLKLIIVEPKYQMNIGYIARVASNFGIQRLFIVNPRVNIRGNKAIMFSKHAHSLLENAKICKDFDEAIKDCDMVIGTTGVLSKANPEIRKVYLAEDAAARVNQLSSKRKNAVIGIVIGRDDTGLSPEELSKCDMITYIGTNEKYPVLNISHALAILLYVFTKKNFEGKYKVSIKGAAIPNSAEYKKELNALLKLFKSSINKKRIRDKGAVYKAFKRMVNNSQPTMHEIKTLIIAFK
jgi:TrmH family RNA methyltransferase